MSHPRAYPHHLLHLKEVNPSDIAALFALASQYYDANKLADKKAAILRGRTQINLFFEASTRTRTSFELAGKRLGMDVININTSVSATQKGESLIDMAQTLSAMRPDILVVRHAQSGAVDLLADFVKCKVINAGDGCSQHPTQALLDGFTIKRHKGRIDGLRIAICGDIAHSRVARSNLQLLGALGASICLVAPPQLMPSKADLLGCDTAYRLKEGIEGADVVMLLRVQHERMQGSAMASIREYHHLYGMNHERLKWAKPDALVMHPGPINRGVEIDTALADDVERNVLLDQVEAGVAIRMALLSEMLK